MPKDAIKITDKLIDTLQSQLVDFEDILTKLRDQNHKITLNELPVSAKIEAIRKKGS